MRCHSVGCGMANGTQSAMQSATRCKRSRSHDAVIRVYDAAGQRDRDARARGQVQKVIAGRHAGRVPREEKVGRFRNLLREKLYDLRSFLTQMPQTRWS